MPVPQVLCHLQEDIKETLQVRGAGAVLGVKLDTVRGVRQDASLPAAIPQPQPPGPRPHAHLKKGLCWCTRPSLERSLALVKSGSQPGGRLPACTAKPWFCAVMKQRCVSSCRQGWLCPRFPYLRGGTAVRQPAPAARTPAAALDPHSLHLVGTGTERQGKQLVSQADAKNGLGLGCIQQLA